MLSRRSLIAAAVIAIVWAGWVAIYDAIDRSNQQRAWEAIIAQATPEAAVTECTRFITDSDRVGYTVLGTDTQKMSETGYRVQIRYRYTNTFNGTTEYQTQGCGLELRARGWKNINW